MRRKIRDNMADLDEEFINDIHNSYEEDTPEVVGPEPGTDDPLASPSRPPTKVRAGARVGTGATEEEEKKFWGIPDLMSFKRDRKDVAALRSPEYVKPLTDKWMQAGDYDASAWSRDAGRQEARAQHIEQKG
eukprot:g23273.t1